jgi:ABC-type transport system involved in cytochrome bd biosynthesis fused ATPase/permease subunit
LEREKVLLSTICDRLLESEAKESDLALLRQLILHLDDLFLLVIVGEFNSGKTSVINTLLGMWAHRRSCFRIYNNNYHNNVMRSSGRY